MNKTELIRTITNTINGLEASKFIYMDEQNKDIDGYIMWLNGKIDGMKFVIKMLESELADA